LKSPKSVRAAIHYVVNNWRKHGEDRTALLRDFPIDPFSSAISFPGWRELADRARGCGGRRRRTSGCACSARRRGCSPTAGSAPERSASTAFPVRLPRRCDE